LKKPLSIRRWTPQDRPSTPEPTTRALTPAEAKWLEAWAGVVALAVVNGALHRAYEPALGDLPAHQLSGVVLVMLVLGWAVRVQRRHPLVDAHSASRVGAGWAVLTMAFEFLFFHYAGGESWTTLVRDYDLTQGRVWALTVLGIGVAPELSRRLVRRSTRGLRPYRRTARRTQSVSDERR
jgi:hypothetical protein